MRFSKTVLTFTLLVSMLGTTAFAAPALTPSTEETAPTEATAAATPEEALAPALTQVPAIPSALISAMPTDLIGNPAQTAIQDFITKGYIEAYSDGTFKPDGEITRAEFMTLINKSHDFTAAGDIAFSDVPVGDRYFGEVSKAKAAGYISGYGDGTMRPNSPITHQEAAAIIFKLKGLSADEAPAAGLSDSVNIAPWAKGAVGAVVKAGVMKGDTNNAFKPEKMLVRAEAVAVVSGSLIVGTADPVLPVTPVIPPITETPVTPVIPETPADPQTPVDSETPVDADEPKEDSSPLSFDTDTKTNTVTVTINDSEALLSTVGIEGLILGLTESADIVPVAVNVGGTEYTELLDGSVQNEIRDKIGEICGDWKTATLADLESKSDTLAMKLTDVGGDDYTVVFTEE